MFDSNQPWVPRRDPWNKGRLIGQKRPLTPKDVWSIRVRLQLERRARNLALFNLAIDSKLRGCDLVRLQVDHVSVGGRVRDRATIVQRKTGRPVQFEITGRPEPRSRRGLPTSEAQGHCGEHGWENGMPPLVTGSSPHARGTRSVIACQSKKERFIPACAGNTQDYMRQNQVRPVTPLTRIAPRGSSPHARGTPPTLYRPAWHRRFIPACAGNTVDRRIRSRRLSVHPRMRGEHNRNPR